jgi:hypothetical protein
VVGWTSTPQPTPHRVRANPNPRIAAD